MWSDTAKPTMATMLVCSAPTLHGRSYCAESRKILTRRAAPEKKLEQRVRHLLTEPV
jgi:hypothetical protein